MSQTHSPRSILAGLTALLAGACTPAVSTPPDPSFDPQACAEDALRRSPEPAIVKDAAAHFSRRCEGSGDVSACSLFGVLLELGLGVRADRARARTLYRFACESGNPRACGNLGELLLADAAPGATPEGALTLLRMSCDAGHGRPCAVLGRIYDRGSVVPRTPAVAASFFERACRRGAVSACIGVADLIEHGDVAAAPARRVELLTMACAHGDEGGCARLGGYPRPPESPSVVVGSRER
jgi:TPR repeat protein